MKLFWGTMLFCNVLAIGMFLGRNDAQLIYWLNLFGCVCFGHYLKRCDNSV
jgi:hypothetical protein